MKTVGGGSWGKGGSDWVAGSAHGRERGVPPVPIHPWAFVMAKGCRKMVQFMCLQPGGV